MNLVNKLKKRRMDNKGFSLVELIIVIAIMAILVGIVGSQVLPYLERSKEGKDMQVLSSLCTDSTSAFSMNADKITAGSVYVVTISPSGTDLTVKKDGSDVTSGTDGAAIVSTLKELKAVTGDYDLDTLALESKKGKALTSVKVTYAADGVVTVDGGALGSVSSK